MYKIWHPKEGNPCDHTCPIQNTKPLRTPKYTPKYTPNPPPKPKYRKNTKKIRNWVIFVFFSYFFCISVLEGDLGCISGCILGFGGVLYFVWGTYDRKENPAKKRSSPRKERKQGKSKKSQEMKISLAPDEGEQRSIRDDYR